MDVWRIINELNRHQSNLEEIPQNHPISRINRRYGGNSGIESIPIWENWPKNDNEVSLRNSPLDKTILQNIWIKNPDIKELPDINFHEIEEEVRQSSGIEALAWYHSFHFIPVEQWGIYITDRGIYYLVQKLHELRREPYHLNTLDLIIISAKILFFHEFFHFITDIAASILEASHSFQKPFYVNYSNRVYCHPSNSEEPLEEALANAFAYNKQYGKGVKSYLKDFMRSQPNGYKHFEDFLPSRLFENGRRVLASQINGRGTNVTPLESLFDFKLQDVKYTDVPLRLVPTIKDPSFVIGRFMSIQRSLIQPFNEKLKKKIKKISKSFPKIELIIEEKLRLLGNDVYSPGLDFKKLVGRDSLWQIRLNKKFRLELQHVNGRFEVIDIHAHH